MLTRNIWNRTDELDTSIFHFPSDVYLKTNRIHMAFNNRSGTFTEGRKGHNH